MVKNALLVVFVTFFLIKVNSKIIIKVKSLECSQGTDWINMTCKLKAVNWKKSLVNVEAELKQDVNKVMIYAQTFKRYNSYQPFPMNVTLELCSILRGSGNNNIFAAPVHEIINKYTNLNHNCPYHKGEKIFVRDLDWQQIIDFVNVNLAGGAGRYRFDVNVCANGEKTKCALIVGHSDLSEE